MLCYTVTKIGLRDRERNLTLMGCLCSEAKQLESFLSLRICHPIYGRVEGAKLFLPFFYYYDYYYFSIIKKKGVEEKRSNEWCVGVAIILYMCWVSVSPDFLSLAMAFSSRVFVPSAATATATLVHVSMLLCKWEWGTEKTR